MLRARAGAPEGLWLRADVQTAGRGRQGRSWMTASGNMLASTIIRVRAMDPPVPTLALVAGLALHRAVSAFVTDRAELKIKWPNDLLLGGAKLGGILLERETDAVVAGFGVNLVPMASVGGRRVASLVDVGCILAPQSLVEALAETLAHAIAEWRNFGLAPLIHAWQQRAHPIGTPLTVHGVDGDLIIGQFAGLNDGGALILRHADRGLLTISAGEVMLAERDDAARD